MFLFLFYKIRIKDGMARLTDAISLRGVCVIGVTSEGWKWKLEFHFVESLFMSLGPRIFVFNEESLGGVWLLSSPALG